MDFCAGACSTAKTCTLLDQHKMFDEGDLDSEVLSAAESDLLSAFALEVFNPNFEIIENEEVRAAGRTIREKVAVIWARRRATVWETPSGLDAT